MKKENMNNLQFLILTILFFIPVPLPKICPFATAHTAQRLRPPLLPSLLKASHPICQPQLLYSQNRVLNKYFQR